MKWGFGPQKEARNVGKPVPRLFSGNESILVSTMGARISQKVIHLDGICPSDLLTLKAKKLKKYGKSKYPAPAAQFSSTCD